MRHGLVAGIALALAGCATEPTPRLPDPSVIAMHEWDHGPPWAPTEIPWVAPPTIAYAPGYYSPWYWGPGVGIGVGVGYGFGRRGWWHGGGSRGFRGGGYRGGGGHFHGGGRGGHR